MRRTDRLNTKPTARLLCFLAVICATAPMRIPQPAPTGHDNVDWPVYRGDPKGNQYVAMAQIHAANVQNLRPAWEYHTGDANQRSTMHANPIVVNGIMYITTPALKAVALNAATGRQMWVFDPAKSANSRLLPFAVTADADSYLAAHKGARALDYSAALAAA